MIKCGDIVRVRSDVLAFSPNKRYVVCRDQFGDGVTLVDDDGHQRIINVLYVCLERSNSVTLPPPISPHFSEALTNAMSGISHENNGMNYDGNGYAPGIEPRPDSEIVAFKNKCSCPLHGPDGLLAIGCQCKGL